MVKKGLLLSIIGFVVLALWVPTVCRAFDTYTFDDGQELTVYGYLRNDTGMFFQKQPLQQNDNQLAAEITWLRTYVDWKINNKLKLFGDIQFAYAPHYSAEDGFSYPSLFSSGQSRSDFYCQYNDVNDVLREAYVQWSPDGANTLKVGRQIAIWGQSLTERVLDVVQPEDDRWGLAFANIEDTRIPEWEFDFMHQFDTLNTSVELNVQPLLTDGPWTVNETATQANYNGLNSPGQLFGMYPSNGVGPGPPFSRGYMFIPNVGYVPFEIPNVSMAYPQGIADTRYGFRTTSMLNNGYTFGIQYYHTQVYNPLIERSVPTGVQIPIGPGISLPQMQYYMSYPTIDTLGAYFNKQCSCPGVVRGELLWVPDEPFNTFDPTVASAIVRRQYIKYMLAYDLNDFLYFHWHETAPFDITIENVGEIIPDNHDLQYLIYDTKEPGFIPRFNGSISTNWLYNRWTTQLIFSYFPWGNSGLIMPAITWTPGWQNNKFSAKLEYIYVYGDNTYEGLGMFKTKSMVLLETQFNF